MTIQTVTDAIRYVGVDDNTLALFENQYPVQPMGVSYNSYVILDEKIAVMDSVDARAAEEWLSNVARVLEGRSPDYLVVTHMEPDHSGSLMRLAQKYPEMKIVGNAKTFTLIKQFFGTGALSEDRMREVGERDTLSLGLHRLRFLLAPMVHWPEVMAAYEEEEKILFSADAFGRFGSLERTARAPWAPQARRYYYNIVGKYGAQVQALLKKISALEIKTICPLHGPMLTEDLGEYLRLYDLWSQWKPEKPEGILIAHASIYGNTAYASEALKRKLEGKGAQVAMCDLTATDLSYSCSKEHSHDGEPMAVCRGLGNKTQEILLLRFSECDPPFRLWSAAIRLELAVNALAGIFADVIVVHGHFKRRVNNGVDALQ